MESKPRLYMVGLIAEDLERSHDFYGRLGLDFDVEAGTHREAKAEQLTLFLDGRPSAWHPNFKDRPYPWLLEFFFDSLADLRSKLDELTARWLRAIRRAVRHRLRHVVCVRFGSRSKHRASFRSARVE